MYNEKLELFESLAKELHLPFFKTYLTFDTYNRDGKLTHRHQQHGHSWTRNAYNFVFLTMAAKNPSDNTFGAGKLSAKDTGGTVRYNTSYPLVYIYNQSLDAVHGYRAVAGNSNYGIIIGSGITAESFEDYTLATKIAHGTSAGQLQYTLSDVHSISYANLTLKNTLGRMFDNGSGGSVDVNEVGLVGRIYIYNVAYYFLLSRDVLVSTITVPSTEQLRVAYSVSLVYPS